MNKFVRFLVGLVLIVALGILILAFIEPKDVTVRRSTLIKANKEQVFDQVVHFKNWPNWSMLQQRDTSMKVVYFGDDGTIGSGFKWTGNEHISGTGEMANEGLNGTIMTYSFKVTEPGDMMGDGIISVTDKSDGRVEVSWSFHKHFPFLANAVLVVFDLDKYIGGDIDADLASLKQYMEQHNTAPVVDIRQVDYPARIFAGIRQTVSMAEIGNFCMNSFNTASMALGPRKAGYATALYYTWDTTRKQTDMAAVYTVTDSATTMPGITYMTTAPATAYMAVHKGGYATLGAVHNALMKHVAAAGKAQQLVIEEYIVAPAQDADSTKWVTNIYYLVQ